MWRKWLLSLPAIFSLTMTLPSMAQRFSCGDEKATDSAITHIQKTYSYVSMGWQNACDSLLAVCPNLDQVWQMKAMPGIKMGDWNGCFKNLEHAVALKPKTWLSYQAFLKCLFSKDYRGAIADFNRCDTLTPDAGVMDHSFDFYRGLCYLGLGDLKAAETWLGKDFNRQAKTRGKENVHYNTCYYLGVCQFLSHDYTSAESNLRLCLNSFAQYPEPSYYLGLTLLAQGRRAEAIQSFEAAAKYLSQGYNSNEDQEFYINYPYAISIEEIREQLRMLQ